MKHKPSIEAMEILAGSDKPVFESLMKSIGLVVNNQSNKKVTSEAIMSIASEITEDASHFVERDPSLAGYRQLAYDYGYTVNEAG